MTRSAPIAIALIAVIYDGFIIFMVWFTIAFFGSQDLFVPSIGAFIFWIIAISPAAVTAYCIIKLLAVRRGEKSRV